MAGKINSPIEKYSRELWRARTSSLGTQFPRWMAVLFRENDAKIDERAPEIRGIQFPSGDWP